MDAADNTTSLGIKKASGETTEGDVQARLWALLLDLPRLRQASALVRAVCLLAAEGVRRAPMLAVVERAQRESAMTMTPSEAGKVFATLGIGTVLVHGRNRLVLDPDQLARLHQQVAARVREAEAQVRAMVQELGDVAARLDELEALAQDTYRRAQREQELRRYLQSCRERLRSLPLLEAQYQQLRKAAERAELLEAQYRELARKAEALPDLRARHRALQQALTECAREEAETTQAERSLASRLSRLQERRGWLTLAGLEEAIAERRIELGEVERRLAEKRPLLDRLLGRRGEGGAS